MNARRHGARGFSFAIRGPISTRVNNTAATNRDESVRSDRHVENADRRGLGNDQIGLANIHPR